MTMTAGSPAKPDLIAQLGAGDLAGEWALDATRSQARIATRSVFGAVPVKGTFTALTGSATVSDRGEARGRLTIGTTSLDTRNARRDTHLKSASFLDAANHPAIEFALSRIETSTESARAVGALTVRETTRPVTVPYSPAAETPRPVTKEESCTCQSPQSLVSSRAGGRSSPEPRAAWARPSPSG
jgi:polyisoprenoid-binding protein YceI